MACALAGFVWITGTAFMHLPLGDGLQRVGYDYLHIFSRPTRVDDVLVIAINEETDRKLGVPQNQSISRDMHSRLLERLTRAGAALVCYDILFDRSASEPRNDERFCDAIRANGRVILGASEELERRDGAIRATKIVGPVEKLRKAASAVGLLNTAPADPDGVIRRFYTASAPFPPLALAAARAISSEIPPVLPDELWLFHKVRPGEMPTLEFAECLEPTAVPDERFRGKAIFVGGQYSSTTNGRPDLLPTPLSRFGGPPVYGVTWHATAFTSLHGEKEKQWFAPAGLAKAAFFALPFGILSVLMLRIRSMWVCAGVWFLAAVALSLAGLYAMWEQQVLVNWLVPGLIQLPCCIVGLMALKWIGPPADQAEIAALLRELEGLRNQGKQRRVIFGSATSGEFESHRDALMENLRLNFEVHGQGELPPIGTKTLNFLDDFVRDSNCVVHLVGRTTGSPASKPAIAALRDRYPDLVDRLTELQGSPGREPDSRVRLNWETSVSYTQWEAYLAEYHGKDLLIAVPVPASDERPAVGAGASEAEQRSQTDHLARLRAMGRHQAITFSTEDELVVKVLGFLLHEMVRGARTRRDII